MPYTQYVYSDGTTCGVTLPDVAPASTRSSRPGILDSRAGRHEHRALRAPRGAQGRTRDINVAGQGGVPADADAVVLNVTVVNATAHLVPAALAQRVRRSRSTGRA